MTELRIDRLGGGGDGVADTADGPVYVPFSAPGDVVAAALQKPKDGTRRATVRAVVTPSPDRQPPVCVHFGHCGGCSVQHVADVNYRAWKVRLVEDALARRGLRTDLTALVQVPVGSRRTVRIAFRTVSGRVLSGFREAGSRHIVDLRECAVSRPSVVALLPALRRFLRDVGGAGEVAITVTGTGADVVVHAPGEPDLELREAAARFADRQQLARLSWARRGEPAEPLVVRRPPVVAFDGIEVELPPGAFVQPTAEGEDRLRAIVTRGIGDAGRIADLYAGCGAFSLPLARGGRRVTAVEGVPQQTDAMTAAARRDPALQTLAATTRDLARQPLSAKELDGFDAVVLDPPRSGAGPQAERLAESAVPRIVYVSCNPATFARDARILADGGYRLDEVTPVDQFLWTPHVELGALFSREG